MDESRVRTGEVGDTMPGLIAQLEALTTRLDDQAVLIEAQANEIALLKFGPAGVVAPESVFAPGMTGSTASKVGRRGVLRKVLGATASAALLTVAHEASTA